MQVVFPIYGKREPILGVVGALQFDIVEARMRNEYGVACQVDKLPHVAARWIEDDTGATAPTAARSARDASTATNGACCCSSPTGSCSTPQRENPSLTLLAVA